MLVADGPRAIDDLVRWGTEFDRDAAGELSLTREGGHQLRRIAHAGGDATGAELCAPWWPKSGATTRASG